MKPSNYTGSPAPSAPRLILAVILLTTSGLTAMVTAVLGPILPKMQAHFRAVPHVDFLVPLTLTVPMLVMAILCVFAGALSDRIGRKRMLVASTACYALFGTAPLYLHSLGGILASRVGLGVMEAAVMTLSTTLIGDYYHGSQREKYMSLQTTTAAVLAFVFNLVGGMLGEYGWQAPFSVYAIGAPLALLMAAYLWEPNRGGPASPNKPDPTGVTFRPLLLAGTCALGLVCGVAFLIVPIHLGYLFAGVEVDSPSRIGLAYALNSLGVICGTLCFGWLLAPRLRVSTQIGLCFAVTGAGCLMLQGASTYGQLTLAAIVNGFGAGLMLPTLVTWNMRELPFARRGLGTGAFQSCLFLGMFINPVVVVGFDPMLGSRGNAVGAVGALLLAAALLASGNSFFKRRGVAATRVSLAARVSGRRH